MPPFGDSLPGHPKLAGKFGAASVGAEDIEKDWIGLFHVEQDNWPCGCSQLSG